MYSTVHPFVKMIESMRIVHVKIEILELQEFKTPEHIS